MPQTSAKRLSVLTMSVAGVITAAGLLGCDDANTVDRRVREHIQESRVARLAGDNEKAQESLQQAAAEADAPNATRAHAKALLARAELDSALSLMTDPEKGIEATNGDIIRLIREIAQLGQQIATTTSMVSAYQALEPIETRKQIEAETAAATGGPERAEWVGKPPVAVPTLSAVKQRVAQLQDQVAKQRQHIESLQKQQKDVAAAAAQAAQKAETMSGQEGLQQYKQASDLRKQAADLANQLEVAQARLEPVQQDLKLAEAQQAAVTRALEQFQQVGQQIEAGWKNIEQQANRQQQLATAILDGSAGDIKMRESIAEKGKSLSEKIKQVQESYAQAEQSLKDAIDHYGEAASAATQLGNDIRPRLGTLPAGNPMKLSLEAMTKVYNPVVFNLGQANAQLALANLQSSRAQTLLERQKVLIALAAALEGAGLKMPATLSDPKIAEQAKAMIKEADEMYAAAHEQYTTVAQSSASDPDRNGGQTGRIYSLYGRALLARLTGQPAAQKYLADARDARDTILQETPTFLAALPAELVVASTQPAAATTGPATAPSTPTAMPAPPAGAKVLPGQPADPALAQTVRQSIVATFTALESGDTAAVKGAILSSPDQQQLVDTIVSLLAGAQKLQKNVVDRFGDEGRTLFQSPQGGMQMPDLAEFQKEVDKLQVRTTGPETVVLVMPGEDEPLPMRQVEGQWKFDLAGLPQQNPQAAAMLPMVAMMMQPIAEGLNQLGDDVAAGKYETLDQVKAAMQQLAPPMPGGPGGPGAGPGGPGAGGPAPGGPPPTNPQPGDDAPAPQ